EYLHSEKYQIRVRDWNAKGNISADIKLLNRIRRETPALQRYANLSFHASENEQILFYRKGGAANGRRRRSGHGTSDMGPGRPRETAAQAANRVAPLEPRTADPDILVAVNLDPKTVQTTMVHVPVEQMGIGVDEPYVVHDLMTGARFTWRGARNYVRLDPSDQVAHLLRVER